MSAAPPSTRHRQRALDLASAHDADRALVARVAFLDQVGRDPRVQARIQAWAVTPAARACVALFHADAAVTDAEARALWTRTRRGLGRQLVQDLRPFDAAWLRRWLADLALVMLVQDQANWTRVEFGFTATGASRYTGPPRRRPKGDGSSIARDVQWFYRARVRHPAESVHALAREYAAATRRRTDARAVVQDGIVRAEVLLQLRRSTP